MSNLSESFSLDSRYTTEEGTIILTGLQALVRVPLDQHRADQKAGLNTATFISGYQGSPLGSYDMMLNRAAALLQQHNVFFQPGVNEDLAATAVFGSQLANTLPDPKYDGVLGIWYGKGPGVDRSGDAFRHAQFAGVGKNGGVLALAGDDPSTKSSTIPSHSEVALYDAHMPVLYPGSIQEIIEMGRYGFEMSRFTGSWSSIKIVTNVADSYGTAEVFPITTVHPEFEFYGRPWRHRQTARLLAPHSNEQEREIHEGRSEAIRRFAAANGLNRITVQSADDRIGLIAAGKTYYDLREALAMLGLRDADLNRFGIRILKLGMISPIEPEILKTFASGLDELFVIEEKRGFMELLIRDALYNEPERPRIIGKKDENGALLVRGDMELDADQCAKLLVERLARYLPDGYFDPIMAQLYPPAPAISLTMSGPSVNRTPYYCSGCPHNRSTVALEGSLVGGGIGCHSMAMLMDRNVIGLTQMGGEGAQWVGMEPFTGVEHIFQNIGDGTLFHSGSMAIRQAVSAGANVTYKILYNGAVAMTGGQVAEGEMPVPALTHSMLAEGASKVLVVADEPEKYPSDTNWPAGVEVWHRDRMEEAQEILQAEKGVTVLIYDQPCATELRRHRKRGKIADPTTRIFINEAVCEGCGDCGVKSNCLSVFPVETEYGRKTRIHQSSCNKDYTCIEGDCPAFVKVETIAVQREAKKVKKEEPLAPLPTLPEPRRLPPTAGNIYTMGIGGTGVVTTNQILATAAMIDGKHVTSLDQTGLSQKGGPVVSHLKVFADAAAAEASNMIHTGQADAYLVFDLLSGTADKNLKRARPDRTTAIVSSSETPTGSMVIDKTIRYPQAELMISRLEKVTRSAENVYFDAIHVAETLYKNHMPANMIVIGAAYQAGLLPISAVALEHAIKLNGVKVAMNQHAFNAGRAMVADPSWFAAIDTAVEKIDPQERPALSPEAQTLLDRTGATGELARLLQIRIPELIAYQNLAYAERYVEFVMRSMAADQEATGSADGKFSQAVARYLFKLMAYKDEYEVARLYMKPEFEAAIKAEFGEKATYSYHLHPPTLKALGRKKKITLGPWFKPFMRLLANMKGLRGTAFDLFGRSDMRRLEQTLIGEYQGLIEQALSRLSPSNYDAMVELAELPDLIRGYDELKWEGTEQFRTRAAEILAKESKSIPAD